MKAGLVLVVLLVGLVLGFGMSGHGHRAPVTTEPAALWITGVHTERVSGAAFPHISRLRLLNGQQVTEAQLIADIRTGTRVFTRATPPGRVYVHAGGYLQTMPDNSPANNLSALPHY